ncbi:ABC transporter ATP-binding protein [Tranquillimonas alkanivorans]|uniref:ATP-binding cassette, subfamily B, MsbA n=1 Tax=Tranquillimonas alkanivorans TaxID=441119 RepID=A0A1I5MBG7_9RHOB|nr:ABC transporter ATP-binding protein [Tranquillimonas alkanivorans]SFP06849.1 ATP-binding cassette, subfamily B, MsbA [Tranquillimonas alkanivorans]
MTRERDLIAWIWRGYLRGHWLKVSAALGLMALEGGMLGLLSYMVKPMFDQVFVAGDRSAVVWVAFGVAGVFGIRALAGFGHRVLMAVVGRRISAQMQSNLLRHMLTLDASYFRDNSPGTLIERVRGDTRVVSSIWSAVLGAAGRDTVALVSLLAVALSVDWLWTLIAVAGAPLLMLPIAMLQRLVRRTTRAARSAAAVISTRLDETFHGINTIKLNGIEEHDRSRFDAVLDRFVGAELRAAAGQAGIPALIDVVAAIGFFGVLVYGGFQIIDGEKSVGEFMSFFTAMALVFEPLRRLGNVSGTWQVAAASLERLHGVFEERPTILSPARPRAVKAEDADVVFEEVSFSYDRDPVLSGLSFTARAGETTALVGPSGAGKSTVFALITRLIEPQSGRVALGETGVEEVDLEALRDRISVVSQETLLFDDTIRENILLGRTDVDDETLREVIEAAHVADFLDGLPRGLDTPAGPRGANLSGGQRQRVAIARALLRDTPILLLDEATSALDAASEAAVQEALERLSQGRTTLVIAHRLSTIQDADRIVVMERGRVVDQGRHEELLARGGLYADLHRLQFAGS